MNRIQQTFARCRQEGRAAYVAYLTMGAPTLAASMAAAETLVGEGADILELGVPFSDPVADGAVIRRAADLALRNGVTLGDVLAEIPAFRRRHPDTPLVIFTYYNVIFSYGPERFAAEAAARGADAVLVVDLPLEERRELLDVLRPAGLTLVPLVAPTTGPERIRAIAKGLEDSFLYAVTVKGTTGTRAGLPPELADRLGEIKALVKLPVVAGFGIRTPEEGAAIAAQCDGFVIGSALVERFMRQ
ncbi:MAG: tryptophan synthase subunit alpha [Kiritimatiellia bacterium]